MGKNTDTDEYMNRIKDAEIERALAESDVVCIDGPKKCGKTRTASHHCSSKLLLREQGTDFSGEDRGGTPPENAVEGEKPRLIEGWQREQRIRDALEMAIYAHKEHGRFILTEPLATNEANGDGRIKKITMRTMSLYESGDSSGAVSLENLCDGRFTPTLTGEVEKDSLARYIVRGGWPDFVKKDYSEATMFTILKNDILSAINEDTQSTNGARYNWKNTEALLREFAERENTVTDTASPGKGALADAGKKEPETPAVGKFASREDFKLLSRLHIMENTAPFPPDVDSPGDDGEKTEIHLCDTSLVCALRDITKERLEGDPVTFELLFESMCKHDIGIYAESFGAVIYYRDYDGTDGDNPGRCAALRLRDGRWCAFETTLDVSGIDSACERLTGMRRNLVEKGRTPPAEMCVLCGLSEYAYRREDGIFIVPITALRP